MFRYRGNHIAQQHLPLMATLLLALLCVLASQSGLSETLHDDAKAPRHALNEPESIPKVRSDIHSHHLGRELYGRLANFLRAFSADVGLNNQLIAIQTKMLWGSQHYTRQELLSLSKSSTMESSDAHQEAMVNITKSGSRFFGDRMVTSLQVVQKYRQGINLNLDFSQTVADKPAPIPVKPFRYGLILAGIEPGETAILYAARGEFTADDLRYAAKSKTLWKIGPIEAGPGERMFNINETINSDFTYNQKQDAGIWQKAKNTLTGIRYPKPAFDLRLVPEALPDPSTSANLAGSLPIAMRLSQVENFYQLELHSSNGFQTRSVSHLVSMPLYKEVNIAYKMNENFSPTCTSLRNILAEKQAPSLNLHYMNLEKKVVSDMRIVRRGSELILVAERPSETESRAVESYHLSYLINF